ncbi:MlaA family lipoprotein [Noviherbaspirillum pedocola]|uniref:VacJ family lipoprotein n=1 Tax=Noviherbaspirillum pedocola TaxID=2801341 RepID=A0A934SW60_9BURK|nr:VacJ family lipoprotein [Noviherbaspirillum pedocola]MBK4733799.1 VacJ family lipoprotein [Noviherbaspirillum pedocola]
MRHAAWRLAAPIALATALAGCATGPNRNPADPLEPFNRTVFSFNDKVDQYALKPVATVYKNTVPSFAQTGVYNFFGNLADVWTAMNNLLQGKGADGVSDIMRVAVNSTLGLFGVLDIASEAGLQKHKQDFGATLGVWGVGAGPYVVLPFLGSSTVRDTAALPADYAADPWRYVDPVWTRNTGSALRIIDLRAGVLNASNLVEEAALDRYEFIRDAYLQRRANKINSGREREGQGADDYSLPEDFDAESKTDKPSSTNAPAAKPSPEPAPAVELQQEKAPAAPANSGSQPAFIPEPAAVPSR